MTSQDRLDRFSIIYLNKDQDERCGRKAEDLSNLSAFQEFQDFQDFGRGEFLLLAGFARHREQVLPPHAPGALVRTPTRPTGV